MKKKLTYKDFLSETLSDKPSKLLLSGADGISEFYLEVLSEKHPSVKRAITLYGLNEQDVYKAANEIEDRVDRVIHAQDGLIPHRKELATALVSGGNFDNYIEVLDNPINCDAVIARSYDSAKYAIKK